MKTSGWLYLSFAGDEGFRGGLIIRAPDVETAARMAHRRGINPGGQVLSGPIPPEHLPPPKYRDRLLTVDEIREFWPDARRLGDAETEGERLIDEVETLDQ